MVVWERMGPAIQFAMSQLVGHTLGPLGLALLVMVMVAVRVGQVRLGWWAALLFFLLMIQA